MYATGLVVELTTGRVGRLLRPALGWDTRAVDFGASVVQLLPSDYRDLKLGERVEAPAAPYEY